MWLLYLRQTEFSVLSTQERDAADWIVVHDVKTFMSSSLESESSPTIVCVVCVFLRVESFVRNLSLDQSLGSRAAK